MRKITALLLCLVLCLGMAACNAFHDHTWSFDAQNHWCDCECGKQIEPLPHNLYENVCSACGVKVLDFGDTRYVESYDEHGSVKTATEYDSNGNILQDAYYEWEYDQDGNPTRRVEYVNGTLHEETTYQPCLRDDLEFCAKERVEYLEEGCRDVSTYNEFGHLLSSTTYLADGSVSTQSTFENTYDDQGNLLRMVAYTDGVCTRETQSIVAPNGELLESAEIHYNADGSIASDKIYDYRFDDQGTLCYRSKTSGGVIVNERYYEADENGRANMVREIAYREDGTKSDEYIFDAQGNQTQHIEYNPDGSIKE